ncbi:MAG: aldehyde dehydrogenase family protein [Pyrinomonadaceae bacterium]|nr:aldehyde dehydrogenase family protein [Pyrinomonadaceae bacterium]
MSGKKFYIGGDWRGSDDSFEVRSPYTNEVLAEVSMASREQITEAISAADAASKELKRLPRYELAEGLRKIAHGIEERSLEFAESIARESAKPVTTAKGEVSRGIATFNWAASEAERFAGEIIPVDTHKNGTGKTGWSTFVPRGIVFGITPFNYPLNLVGHKVAPALASRNSIIIKPSRKTPMTALMLAEVFEKSGLPKSALQVIAMDTDNMDVVFDDERISMISFTGSAEVGWGLKEKAGKRMVSLELGGNAPVIVDDSADFQRSLERSVTGAFSHAGQVCISVQRIYVHQDIFDKWTPAFVERTKKLKTGDPLDDETEVSVMIDEKAAKKAKSWVDEAVSNGAKLLTGGELDGAFLQPTVLTGTDPEMRAVSEEIFAPVVVIEKFTDFSEAIDMANHTRFGLQAGVFTGNLGNAQIAAEHLEYGGIMINDVPTFRVDNMPYGGIKDSGFGREGVRYAMEEMSEIRLVVLNR